MTRDADNMTGRAPHRSASGLARPLPSSRLGMVIFVLGCFGMVLLGYKLAHMQAWSDLGMPLFLVAMCLAAGFGHIRRLQSARRREDSE